MHVLVIFLAITVGITAESLAQSRRSKKKAETAQQPTSLDPTYTQKEYMPKVSRKSSAGATYNLEEEYHERMATLEKTRKKDFRMLAKPQYSDPLYFGHKKLPKKRKPSKMKYCKECGIRH